MRNKKQIFLHIFVWLCVIAVAVPVILLFVWSFVNRWPFPELVPSAWTMRGVQRLFSGYLNINRVLFSSVLFSLGVSVLSVIIGVMTARALAFYEFKFKSLVEFLVLLPVVVPATVYGMGIHMLFINLNINNSLIAVVIVHLICTVPFAVKIMSDITVAAGSKFEEQALTLGASPFKAFLYGSVPVIAPGIVSAMAVSFLMSYTQYYLTLLVGGGRLKTIAVIVMPLIEGADRTISALYSMLYIGSTLAVFVIFQLVSNYLSQKNGSNIGV